MAYTTNSFSVGGWISSDSSATTQSQYFEMVDEMIRRQMEEMLHQSSVGFDTPPVTSTSQSEPPQPYPDDDLFKKIFKVFKPKKKKLTNIEIYRLNG